MCPMKRSRTCAAFSPFSAARPRPHALPVERNLGRRRSGAVSRACRDGLRDDPHDPVAWDTSFGTGETSSRKNIRGYQASEIRDLRLSGVPVTREVRIPLIAYTGDTSPAGLDNCPATYEAKILITELSFIRASHRREKIHKFGHMHLDDFIERADRFRNEVIICATSAPAITLKKSAASSRASCRLRSANAYGCGYKM